MEVANFIMEESPWLLLGLAVLPVVILGLYVYVKDRFNREPWWMLALAFVFGVLSAFPAIWLETRIETMNPYPEESFASAWYVAFAVAAFSEELCKFFFLYVLVWRSKYFDEYFDGIVYATFVALGFACFENILYVFKAGEVYEAGVATGVGRAIFAVPGHFLDGVMMGYFFALAKFSRKWYKRWWSALMMLVVPMLLHGFYDAILLTLNVSGGTSVVLLAFFIWFDVKLWKMGVKRIRNLEYR